MTCANAFSAAEPDYDASGKDGGDNAA